MILDFLQDFGNNSPLGKKQYFNFDIENTVLAIQSKTTSKQSISIELTHQQTLVQKLRQQFLQEAVQGQIVPQDTSDEPASLLLQKIKAEKERLVKEKNIKKDKDLPEIKAEEIPFEIPEGWVWCRLGEIVSILGDGLHGTPQYI